MVGIESAIVNASIDVGEEEDELGHIWNIVLLVGKNYFCDPTDEIASGDGSAYSYFGMTLEDRLNDNAKWIVDSMWLGIYDSLPIDRADLSTTPLPNKTPAKRPLMRFMHRKALIHEVTRQAPRPANRGRRTFRIRPLSAYCNPGF